MWLALCKSPSVNLILAENMKTLLEFTQMQLYINWIRWELRVISVFSLSKITWDLGSMPSEIRRIGEEPKMRNKPPQSISINRIHCQDILPPDLVTATKLLREAAVGLHLRGGWGDPYYQMKRSGCSDLRKGCNEVNKEDILLLSVIRVLVGFEKASVIN